MRVCKNRLLISPLLPSNIDPQREPRSTLKHPWKLKRFLLSKFEIPGVQESFGQIPRDALVLQVGSVEL